jgi:hypothetical protein
VVAFQARQKLRPAIKDDLVKSGEFKFKLKTGSSLTSFWAAQSEMKARRASLASLATVAALLLIAAGARAQEHVSGFANLSEPQSTMPLADWGPVPTDKESIANLAPCLLPFLTVVSGF